MEIKMEIKQETCCNCGINFWITSDLYNDLQRFKRTFYCPNGHPQSYNGESDEAKIRRLQKEKEELLVQKNIEIGQLIEKYTIKKKKKHVSRRATR